MSHTHSSAYTCGGSDVGKTPAVRDTLLTVATTISRSQRRRQLPHPASRRSIRSTTSGSSWRGKRQSNFEYNPFPHAKDSVT